MRAQILRLFWIATLAFAACAAYLSARVTSLLIASHFAVVETSIPGTPPATARRRGAELLSDYRIIDDRNLFNVRPPPPPPPPPVVVAPPPPPILPPTPPPPPAPPPEPPLDLKLVGTAVVAGGKSFAVVSVGADLRVVRETEEIVPGAVLLAVRADRIQVSWRGRTEEFALYETRTLSSTPLASRGRGRPTAPAQRAVPTEAASPPASESVRRVSDDRWVVDAREVDQLRSNMGAVMTQVRVVPNFGEGGQPDGFKVFAIRPGSLFARIGLQNGDVIRRINGIDMQAPDQALAAYQQLQNETTINVEVVRQNQSKTLTYVIQ
ncbi:MAG: PDZ domain-containing protein [Deltaproteobacteria bacterium]|nr:PDZ domain-containing protein [Deltaproteobacteria bacterium]